MRQYTIFGGFWLKALLGVVFLVLIVGTALLFAATSGALRGPVQNYAEQKLGRAVEIGSLHVHPFSFNPSVVVKRLKVANAPWAGSEPMADVERAKVSFSLLSLLRGEVVISNLEIGRGKLDLHRQSDGTANWSSGKVSDEDARLPMIRRMALGSVALKFTDEGRNLAFNGELRTRDAAGSDNRAAFTLEGKGLLNQQPLRVRVVAGSVLNANRDRPYPFDAEATHGRTKITAEGTFNRAFDFSAWRARASVSGPNMASLYALTGVVFPLTKAYSLTGVLERQGDVYRFSDFDGRVGGSDLTGVMTVDLRGKRMMFTADLHSKMLDPEDAGVIFGSEEDKAPRLLPDVKLEVSRLRQMDAEVDYRAAAIQVSTLPLKEVALHVSLDRGRLVVSPMTLTLPQGRVSGTLAVDAREDTPAVALDAVLSGARLETFMPSNTLAGAIGARVKMDGRGNSVHDAAKAARGTAVVVIPEGEIRQAFAELMGVNVARGLGLLLSDNQQQTPIRCAIAHFEGENGVMTAQNIVFDTGVVKADGGGTVNLGTEELDLALRGHPKRLRMLSLGAPVTIQGTLLEPQLGADLGGAAAQVGVAAALGVILTPVAAVLPFVDPGFAEKADCADLLRDARQEGAPVKK